MKKDKKAFISIEFLMALLLTILIFAPACLIASKLFQFSSQAKGSFSDFVDEIKEIQESPEGKGSQILIIDDNSAIIGFNSGKRVVLKGEYNVYWKDPPAFCGGKSCICLFQGIKVEFESTGGNEILTENEFCERLEDVVFAPYKEKILVEVTLPPPSEVEGWEKKEIEVKSSTEDGFIILRTDDFLKDYSFNAPSSRVPVFLEKTPEGITICKESPCPP